MQRVGPRRVAERVAVAPVLVLRFARASQHTARRCVYRQQQRMATRKHACGDGGPSCPHMREACGCEHVRTWAAAGPRPAPGVQAWCFDAHATPMTGFRSATQAPPRQPGGSSCMPLPTYPITRVRTPRPSRPGPASHLRERGEPAAGDALVRVQPLVGRLRLPVGQLRPPRDADKALRARRPRPRVLDGRRGHLLPRAQVQRSEQLAAPVAGGAGRLAPVPPAWVRNGTPCVVELLHARASVLAACMPTCVPASILYRWQPARQ